MALFNPYLFGNNWMHDYVNAKKGIKHVLWKLLIDETSYVQALIDFENFVEGWRPFVNMPTIPLLNMSPHEWWDLIAVDIHTLTPWLNIFFPKFA
jgi:hypothetical protein